MRSNWARLSSAATHGSNTSVRHNGPSVRPCLGVSTREVHGVWMRLMKTSPASLVGGISTASSAFRISFSRTISTIALPGRGGCGDLDARHVSHAAATAFLEGHDDAEMIGIERLSVHPFGQNYLLALEFGGDLSESQHRPIPVSTLDYNSLG